MKTIKFLSIIFTTCLVLTSCDEGGDPDGNDPLPPTPTIQGKFLTLTHNMPATASEETIALTGLSSSITRMAGQDNFNWLTVTKEAYTSGTPKVRLKTVDNPKNEVRSAFIVFLAANDTLALTVNQAANAGGNPPDNIDVDNPHNNVSDQPAFSRQ